MKKAELQWNIINTNEHGVTTSSLSVNKTLEHLVEVINEMQDAITPLKHTNEPASFRPFKDTPLDY